MPKSYKIVSTNNFEIATKNSSVLTLTAQMSLPETVPGPETSIREAHSPVTFEDFKTYDISHEYALHMLGRSYQDGSHFTKFIAEGKIRGNYSKSRSVLLLSGKKTDILDFCRQAQDKTAIELKTLQLDMKALQQKLPEIRGVWFRFKSGFIRAKAFMGQQLQDTPEYCDSSSAGDISTLSFYFEDARDGCRHPVMITEDGAVVLQKNYVSAEEEIDFVLHVKTELLDGLYTEIEPSKARVHVAPDVG